jgi:hypothetical protein
MEPEIDMGGILSNGRSWTPDDGLADYRLVLLLIQFG